MPFSPRTILAVATSFCLALILTPLVRGLARHYGFVAQPKTDRWHKKPTAMLGGTAIWLVGDHHAAGVLAAHDLRTTNPARQHVSVSRRPRRRSDPHQALSKTDRTNSRIGVCRLLRIVFALDRLGATEHGARHLLVDRHHERHQPARQHGWPRFRHRDHRGRVFWRSVS